MQKVEEKHKEPLNVVALLCLVIGMPTALMGAWQVGFTIMIVGLAASVVAYIRYQRHKRRA